METPPRPSNHCSDLVIRNAAQVVCVGHLGNAAKPGEQTTPLRAIQGGTVVVRGGRIEWVGSDSDCHVIETEASTLDATGKVVLPGFVDSHTHLIFAGTREDEFEQRLEGRTYQEIAAHGGGINATVRRVREATKEELKALARRRLDRLLQFGVTTVEVKSGYGLTLADEIKCLEIIAELNAKGPLELVPTFLGAHAVPPEYRS